MFKVIMESVQQYGIVITLIGLVIGLLGLFMWHKIKNKLDSSKISNDNFSEMMIDFEKKKLDAELKRSEEDFERNIKSTQLISDKLNELRFKIGVPRITIYQYHNGTTLKSGFGFKKFSATHIKLDANTKLPNSASLFKDMPISACYYFNLKLIQDGSFHFKDVKELEEVDSTTFHILDDQGVGSIYCEGMYDINGKIFAWISLEWEEAHVLEDECKKIISDITRTINMLLV